MRYGLKGKAMTGPDFFSVVLGPYAQFYPCEASEQKWGQNLNQNSFDVDTIRFVSKKQII